MIEPPYHEVTENKWINCDETNIASDIKCHEQPGCIQGESAQLLDVQIQAGQNRDPETHDQRGSGRPQYSSKIYDPLTDKAGGDRSISASCACSCTSLPARDGIVNAHHRLAGPKYPGNGIYQIREVAVAPIGIVGALVHEGGNPA